MHFYQNLSGLALDWAVATAQGYQVKVRTWQDLTSSLDPVADAESIAAMKDRHPVRLSIEKKPGAGWFPAPSYSTDLAAAWAILDGVRGLQVKHWLESKPDTKCEAHIHNYDGDWVSFAPSITVAALRCYVGWKLGDMIQVPEELLQH